MIKSNNSLIIVSFITYKFREFEYNIHWLNVSRKSFELGSHSPVSRPPRSRKEAYISKKAKLLEKERCKNAGGTQEECRRNAGGTQEERMRITEGTQDKRRKNAEGTQEERRRDAGGTQ